MTLPARSVLLLLDASTTMDHINYSGPHPGHLILYGRSQATDWTYFGYVIGKSAVFSLPSVNFANFKIIGFYHQNMNVRTITFCLSKLFAIRENYLNSYIMDAYLHDWILTGASTTKDTVVSKSNSLLSWQFS